MQKALSELPKVSSAHTFVNHISPIFPAILYAGYEYKAHFLTLGYLTAAVDEKRTNKNLSALITPIDREIIGAIKGANIIAPIIFCNNPVR